MSDYIRVYIDADEVKQEVLLAMLHEIGFEGFEQNESQLIAFIPKNQFNEEELTKILIQVLSTKNFKSEVVENQNWNALWESNFEPITIGNDCYVKALFHPERPGFKFTITIQPKMSFGTGHHSTTQLVMEQMLKMNLAGKSVLDMGCGTGVLAILAEMMGATRVLAIDNDEWAYINSIENVAQNFCRHTQVMHGDQNLLGGEKFDVILSNITRNANLENFAVYQKVIVPHGILICSGFMEEDIDQLAKSASINNFTMVESVLKNTWATIVFKSSKQN